MPKTDSRLSSDPPRQFAAADEGGGSSGDESTPTFAAGCPMGQAVPRTLLTPPNVVMLDQPRSVTAEKFWRLKTKLFKEHGESLRVIVVTSPAPREGKSFVALNLALALAADAGDTLLVDADLRRPTLHHLLSPPSAIGLSEILGGSVGLDHGLVRLKNTRLRVLPGGKAVPDPVELLSSDNCKKVFAVLRQGFQRIVVDTPPIVPFTDADALAAFADGVLMVVRSGATPRSAYKQALSLVTSTRILGVVLNDVTFSLADSGHYHEYYHSYYSSERKGK